MWFPEKNYLKGYSDVSRPLATVYVKRKCVLVDNAKIKLETYLDIERVTVLRGCSNMICL